MRGGAAARVPTSVPHVSAVAAASPPAPRASHAGEGRRSHSRAAIPKTPPFARTCTASRSFPLAITLAVRCCFVSSPIRDRTAELTKNATRSVPQLQPAAIVIVPRATAAMAPPVPSAPYLRAVTAMAAAIRNPAMVRAITDPRTLAHEPRHGSQRRRSTWIGQMREPGSVWPAKAACCSPNHARRARASSPEELRPRDAPGCRRIISASNGALEATPSPG